MAGLAFLFSQAKKRRRKFWFIQGSKKKDWERKKSSGILEQPADSSQRLPGFT
jgi:hypothetical protein